MAAKKTPTARYRNVLSGRFVANAIGQNRPTWTIRDVMDGSASGSDTHIVERDAGSGRFVPIGTANLYPDLTSTERVRNS